jgi:hypothetical protein
MVDTALEYVSRFLGRMVAESVGLSEHRLSEHRLSEHGSALLGGHEGRPQLRQIAARVGRIRDRLRDLSSADVSEVTALYAETKSLLYDLWQLM